MNNREYHKGMDARMFDFPTFYLFIARDLPQDSVIAEVGVATGTSSVFLAETLLNMEKRFRLLMIDNLAYGSADQLQTIVRNVCAAGLGQWVEIIPFDSLVASTRYPDNHFDFVFIDSSHKVEPTKAEIRAWYHKIKHRGILAGHDWNHPEVRLAVEHVIPPEKEEGDVFLHVEETRDGNGVWWIIKDHNVKLR